MLLKYVDKLTNQEQWFQEELKSKMAELQENKSYISPHTNYQDGNMRRLYEVVISKALNILGISKSSRTSKPGEKYLVDTPDGYRVGGTFFQGKPVSGGFADMQTPQGRINVQRSR